MLPYGSYTHGDTFTPKRWAHQRRFDDALKLVANREPTSLLDYGCGDGFLLKIARERWPQARLVGYDPLPNMAAQARQLLVGTSISIVEQLDEVAPQTFTVVTCLETCEHLVPEELERVFTDIEQLLDLRSVAIFSVPIELGPVSLVKNIYRALRRKQYENLTMSTVLATLFGHAPKQFVNMALGNPYIFSHIGFDHRKFQRQLEKHFTVVRIVATPWPMLGPWLNPTVNYMVRAKQPQTSTDAGK